MGRTSSGSRGGVLPSTREGEVSTPARIPSRLGEPGSLFSRYKFLQLWLVVVMLLTRTRRELLKRRTIGAYIPIPDSFLEPRVTRHPLRHRRQPPLHLAESSSWRFFSSASFINLGMRTLFWVLWLWSYIQRISILCLCDLHSGPDSNRGIATVNLHCIYYSSIFSLCGEPNNSGPRNILLWRAK